jgi:hypothetical protein
MSSGITASYWPSGTIARSLPLVEVVAAKRTPGSQRDR